MSAESGRATFRTIFGHWHVVAVSAYIVALFPFLVLPREVAPVGDQLVAHALIVAAATSGSALWASALSVLARALSFATGSAGAREQVVRSSASAALSCFLVLVLAFGAAAIRSGEPGGTAILDLLLATPAVWVACAVLVAVFHLAAATRFREPIEDAFARMRRLGGILSWCTLPFLLIVLAHSARLAWPTEKAPAAPRPAPGAPNIVVIVLDALPMGKTSLVPGGEELTPSLRRFSERSVLFTRAYSAANVTTPSVATLLTGKHPSNHGLHEVKMSLRGAAREETLPMALRMAGFRTGAMVSNFEAHPRLMDLGGFDRVFPMGGRGPVARALSATIRFAEFHLPNLWSFSVEGWFLARFPDRGHAHPWPPERNFSDGLSFLSGPGRPRFAYIHVMPPHSPYLADPPYMYSRLPVAGFMDTPSSSEIGLYRSYPESERGTIGMLEKRFEETVLSVDRRLGLFLDKLEAAGRFDDSVIVVLSDHGEMFEPRWVGHLGPYLDDALVHVPLLIHFPGQKGKRAVDAPIGLVDIAPTLLDLGGVPVPRWMDGASWKGVFHGGPAPDRPAYSQTSGAILSVRNGRRDAGSCRATRGSGSAILDLGRRRLVVAGPAGTRLVDFGDPGHPDSGAGPGTDGFGEAIRQSCPGKTPGGDSPADPKGPRG